METRETFGEVYFMCECSIYHRVFSEVPFWNSAEYGILYGIDFISRNFLLLNTAEFRGIPYKFVYTEFRIPVPINEYKKHGYKPGNVCSPNIYLSEFLLTLN